MPTKEEKYDEAIELQQGGNLQGAVDKLHELLGQEPDYALAHSALSVFYDKLQQADKAVDHARKVCELEPEDPFSFMAMSLICQKAGKLPEAEQALTQAREASLRAQQGETS